LSNTKSNIRCSDLNLSEETYSDRINLLLIQRGSTKKWLADKLGITKQALNMLLKRNKKPKFINEIAEVFNVSPQWLLTGNGTITVTEKNEIINTRAIVYNLSALLQDNRYVINPIEVHLNPELDAFCIYADITINDESFKIPHNATLVFLKHKPINSNAIALVYEKSAQKIRLLTVVNQSTTKLETSIFVPGTGIQKITYNIGLDSTINILGVLDEIRLKI